MLATPMALRLRVRELRDKLGLTQAQLAKRAGVRVATLSEIENEQTRGIRFDVLERLADALEVDPSYLLMRVPDKRRTTKRQ